MPEPPILEFDPDRRAIIEPGAWFSGIDGIASRAVISWMSDAVDAFLADKAPIERFRFVAESARIPIHEVTVDAQPVVIAKSDVGAPISAALLECMIALGCETFVSVGSSGGLTGHHAPGTVVIPTAAIRDEGVSYHYLAPDREVELDANLQSHVSQVLNAAGIKTVRGKLWTTDAVFRETADRVARRISEGALAVDMESSALAAVGRFRGVQYGHATYIADTLHGETWDSEGLINPDRAFRLQLLEAVARACVSAPLQKDA